MRRFCVSLSVLLFGTLPGLPAQRAVICDYANCVPKDPRIVSRIIFVTYQYRQVPEPATNTCAAMGLVTNPLPMWQKQQISRSVRNGALQVWHLEDAIEEQ
ncbi:MAG: hypothetical protein P8M30_17060 [Planctomycetaceae bacterium]|nr:hypothetical protein [Planctomycetaceae bacterium]MDC0307653.1 hypothetical protein [Planctomycetaceae bacterium]MDG2391019.1 hypothetical protein [Planctomycetaceae bacterium]